MRTKTKEFDCVEMQDRAALRIHNALKGKTREEKLAYWRQRHAEALEELRQAREARAEK
ncbi:MAG: hypothetical protein HY706_21430 [Candidatus Hydrogenedentes bacterium]|nr:hypothetical protein [Candidatus Hydrogenedentota bacterium]